MIKPGSVAFIGFGEAAQAFVEGWGDAKPRDLRAFDRKTTHDDTRAAKRADYSNWSVLGAESLAQALDGAETVISLVTADQSAEAARTASARLAPGALYFDMNSVAPDTKRAAEETIAAAGGRYVDVAVMSPVRPALLSAPLLVSGPNAESGAAALTALGFKARIVEGGVGAASAIKMIRSIMIKGMEALSAECILSAYAAGVQDEVVASLEASDPAFDWRRRLDYNLDRMMIHGARRAAEMRESALTANGLGQSGRMGAAIACWQDSVASLALNPPPEGLDAKVRAILSAQLGSSEGEQP
ncbi:MAG: DUF1932 domain-containing protein [Brevundimonas sp.]